MAASLSDQTIDLVKATVPALETHGLAITRRMYERMFQNPEIRDLFNQSHHGETGSQPKALAAAVVAYARNIDNLGALASRVERIAESISTALVESAVNAIVAKRMNKKQQMRWNRATVQPFLDVRTAVLNGTLEDAFRQRYPGFWPTNGNEVVAVAA